MLRALRSESGDEADLGWSGCGCWCWCGRGACRAAAAAALVVCTNLGRRKMDAAECWPRACRRRRLRRAQTKLANNPNTSSTSNARVEPRNSNSMALIRVLFESGDAGVREGRGLELGLRGFVSVAGGPMRELRVSNKSMGGCGSYGLPLASGRWLVWLGRFWFGLKFWFWFVFVVW